MGRLLGGILKDINKYMYKDKVMMIITNNNNKNYNKRGDHRSNDPKVLATP